jgi:hypothetical protein
MISEMVANRSRVIDFVFGIHRLRAHDSYEMHLYRNRDGSPVCRSGQVRAEIGCSYSLLASIFMPCGVGVLKPRVKWSGYELVSGVRRSVGKMWGSQ